MTIILLSYQIGRMGRVSSSGRQCKHTHFMTLINLVILLIMVTCRSTTCLSANGQYLILITVTSARDLQPTYCELPTDPSGKMLLFFFSRNQSDQAYNSI